MPTGPVSFIEVATANFLFTSLSFITNAMHAIMREVKFYLGFSFLVLLEGLRHFSFGSLRCAAPFYMQAFTGHTAFAIDSKVKWETWQRLASAAWPDLIQAPCQAWPSLAQQRGEEGGRRISLLGTSSPPRRHCGAMSLCLGSTPQSTGMTKLYEGGLSKFSPCSILYICLLLDEFNR